MNWVEKNQKEEIFPLLFLSLSTLQDSQVSFPALSKSATTRRTMTLSRSFYFLFLVLTRWRRPSETGKCNSRRRPRRVKLERSTLRNSEKHFTWNACVAAVSSLVLQWQVYFKRKVATISRISVTYPRRRWRLFFSDNE